MCRLALRLTFCGFKKLGISEHKTVKPPQMLMRGRMFIKPLNPQFLKPAVIGSSSVRPKMCRVKFVNTLSKEIYIRSGVRQITIEPVRWKKLICKKRKGGFFGWRKKYSLKKIACSVGLCVF